MAKSELRVSLDGDVKASLDALARASGRTQADIVEQALRILLDPLPVLVTAAKAVAAYQAQAESTAQQIRVIADYVVDAHRASDRSISGQ